MDTGGYGVGGFEIWHLLVPPNDASKNGATVHANTGKRKMIR